MSRLAGALAALAALAVLSEAGCRSESPPAPPSTPAGPPAVAVYPSPTPATPAAASAPAVVTPRVGQLLKRLGAHGGCSRLMGCAVAAELVHEGRDAVGPLIALYRGSRGDAYWRRRVLEILGRIGQPAAVPFLIERLRDPAEPHAVDVALALGHMKALAAKQALLERQASTPTETALPLRLALAYALVRIGERSHWKELGAVAAPDRAATLPAPALETLLAALRWLDTREEGAPAVVAGVAHENVFVRRDAIRLAADWRLHAAVPGLIARLEDETPGVRRLAQETLEKITRFRHKTGRDPWERWCRAAGACPDGIPSLPGTKRPAAAPPAEPPGPAGE